MANGKEFHKNQIITVPVYVQELLCGGTAEELAEEFSIWMKEYESKGEAV